MELQTALTTTRAVRKRLDLQRPVGREIVRDCLRLAFQAPNGSNQQLWRWMVVDDPAVRATMAEIYRDAIDAYANSADVANIDYSTPEALRISDSVMYLRDHLHEVPVLVVPLLVGRLDRAGVFHQASMWGSVLPAAWSFMLALRERGLGSAWTTVHLHREREMADALGVPFESFTQAGLFPVAYTIGTEFSPAPRRSPDDVVRWNQWTSAPTPPQEDG